MIVRATFEQKIQPSLTLLLVHDGDVSSAGEAVFALGSIEIRNEREIVTATHLAFGAGLPVVLREPVRNPIVRIIDAERVLVAAARRKGSKPNGWIYGRDGSLLHSCELGDGIEAISIVADHVVVSYFDEGILGHDPLSRGAIQVFDTACTPVWSLAERFPTIAAVDIYAIAAIDEKSFVFSAYGPVDGKPGEDIAGGTYIINLAGTEISPRRPGPASLVVVGDAAQTMFLRRAYRERHLMDVYRGRHHMQLRSPDLPAQSRGIAGGRVLSVNRHGVEIRRVELAEQ